MEKLKKTKIKTIDISKLGDESLGITLEDLENGDFHVVFDSLLSMDSKTSKPKLKSKKTPKEKSEEERKKENDDFISSLKDFHEKISEGDAKSHENGKNKKEDVSTIMKKLFD